MITRSRLGWLRSIFGSTRHVEGPRLSIEAGQSTASPPLLTLCPAVGLNDNLRDGEWPEDPDTVPHWLIAREKRCIAVGIGPFRYRTRREFEHAIALCTAALEPKMQPAQSLTPQLPPAEAAKAFLVWLRANDHDGEHTDAALRELYAEHCAAERVSPSPEQTMRKFLSQLGGVNKAIKEAGTIGNHRKRGTVWIIKPSLAKVVEKKKAVAAIVEMRQAA